MTVFINKGDKPLSIRQATTRGAQIVARQLGAAGARAGDETIFSAKNHEELPQRLIDVLALLPGSPSSYSEYAAQWELSNETNSANNLFNHQLAAYKKYSQRLEQYRLSDGRQQQSEDRATGEYTDEGVAIKESVIVSVSIDPIPAQIERLVFNEETGEESGLEMVDNPLVVADETERAEAQYIISQIPAEVADFYSSLVSA